MSVSISISSLALLVTALPSGVSPFRQPLHLPRWPRSGCGSIGGFDSCGRPGRQGQVVPPFELFGGGPTALPVVADESHPAVLPSNPKGVIFDMDGTLIEHAIDFADMRRRIHEVVDSDPIGRDLERDCVLALAKRLSPEGEERCGRIFAEIERRAREDMTPMEGGVELVAFLRENGLRVAVLTRNLERNVSTMRNMYLDGVRANGRGGEEFPDEIFDPIVARDTKYHPTAKEPIRAKPHPDGILHVCDAWGCDPSEVIMVGDSANDDMTAANRARCGGAVLLQPGGKTLDTDSGYEVGDSDEEVLERTPSLRVESLAQLQLCLEALLEEQDVVVGDVAGDRLNPVPLM